MLFGLNFLNKGLFPMIFFADAPPPPPQEGGLEQMFMMIAIALLFFYFIMWRPEKKRRKAIEAKREALKKGDRVIVAGGIIAQVVKIEKETIIVQLNDGAKMEVLKFAVQDIEEKSN